MNLTEAIIFFVNLFVCCQCSTYIISEILFQLTISAVSLMGFRLNWPHLKVIRRGRSQSKSRLIGRRAMNFNLCILIEHKLCFSIGVIYLQTTGDVGTFHNMFLGNRSPVVTEYPYSWFKITWDPTMTCWWKGWYFFFVCSLNLWRF